MLYNVNHAHLLNSSVQVLTGAMATAASYAHYLLHIVVELHVFRLCQYA